MVAESSEPGAHVKNVRRLSAKVDFAEGGKSVNLVKNRDVPDPDTCIRPVVSGKILPDIY